VRKRRDTTAGLRQKFGPEYDRAVLARNSKAESLNIRDLEQFEGLNIRDLDPTEHAAIRDSAVSSHRRDGPQ